MSFNKRKRIKSTRQILHEMNGVVKMCLNKVKYHTESEVSEKAKSLATRGTPMFYYHCPNCNAYHLTRTPR